MMEKSSNDAEIIRENIESVREKIAVSAAKSGRVPEDISLVAVTKTKPADFANAAIDSGVKIIGENRVQELLQKLPDINLRGTSVHLIGHLQTNKVHQIIGCVDMIQSLDSLHLAEEINRQAEKIGKVMDVLIEVNIGDEASKSGVQAGQAVDFAQKISSFGNLRLRGLMSVPPALDDKEKLRPYFQQMRKLFIDIREKKSDNSDISILSMGMSSDFDIAIEEGSNMVRVGSAIFGKRN